MMAKTTASGSTSVQVVTEAEKEDALVLRLHKPKTDKQVQWEEGVVDNEFMGKKSSKCCCVYSKPHKFDESDTESDSGDDRDKGCCHEHRVARRLVPHKSPQPPQMGDT